MPMTRAKFKCESVTLLQGDHRNVSMLPVTSGSDENKSFWTYTPSGHLKMDYINPNVNFEPGKEYYLDISEAG